MTKARDLSNLANGVPNGLINLDSAEIPNLDASKITTGTFDASKIGSGTFANDRISESSVSQHATSFDDNKIVNDISTLALTQASNDNRSAYNTNSQFVDIFQDATGIDTTTNATRNTNEYISTVVAAINGTLTDFTSSNWNIGSLSSYSIGTGTFSSNGSPDEDGMPQTNGASSELNFAANKPFQIQGDMIQVGGNGRSPSIIIGAEANFASGTPTNTSPYQIGARFVNSSVRIHVNTSGAAGGNILTFDEKDSSGTQTNIIAYAQNISINNTTVLIERDGEGYIKIYSNGVLKGTSINPITAKCAITLGSEGGSPNQFSITNFKYSIGTPALANATGNFTGTTITAPSSVSSMGAIITYQDNAGTNALNTDIVLELSADNGSNWSTATLSALPNFSTGIKMAKVNDLAVTAGTQLKYRLSFADQAIGTKEARIRGVALQY